MTYQLAVKNNFKQLNALNYQILQLKTQLTQLEQDMQNLKTMRANARIWHRQFKTELIVLKNSYSLNSLITQITELLRTQDLNLIKISPSKNLPNHIQLEALGTYEQLVHFIYQMRNLPILMQIKKLHLHVQTAASTLLHPNLQIQMEIEVYH